MRNNRRKFETDIITAVSYGCNISVISKQHDIKITIVRQVVNIKLERVEHPESSLVVARSEINPNKMTHRL